MPYLRSAALRIVSLLGTFSPPSFSRSATFFVMILFSMPSGMPSGHTSLIAFFAKLRLR
jgi:hypothetical protein